MKNLLTYEEKTSHIESDELDFEYLPEFAPYQRCIGEELGRSQIAGTFHQPDVVHNLELTLYVALRSIEELNAKNALWHRWSGRPKDVIPDEDPELMEEVWRRTWLRTLFRVALCMPLGYLVAQTAFRSDKPNAPRWSPASLDYEDYEAKWGKPLVHPSEITLAPRPVSYAAYIRLYGANSDNIPMLSMAESDFFADRPNEHNPLAICFARAIRHIIANREHLQLPFWWAFAINHVRVADPDFVPLASNIRTRKSLRAVSKVSPETQDTMQPQTPKPDEPSTSAKTPGSPIVQQACRVISQQFQQKNFTANQGGAVFQIYNGRVHLVVPAIWQKLVPLLGIPNLTPTKLHQDFVASGILAVESVDAAETVFNIIKPGKKNRLGKCRTLPLSDYGETVIFPGGLNLNDNEDLVLSESSAVAAAV
jgi:hypothetical protein